MDIHRSSIKDFILPKVKSTYLIDYYEGIQSILIGREDFCYKGLFANPRVRTQSEIIWSTENFSKRPVLLSDLSGIEKDKYSYLLNQCIHSLEHLIDILKEEAGGQPLSELLSKSIPYIDEQSVYCGEDKIVLVNWGLIPRTQEQKNGQIYRSGKFIGNWDNKHSVSPIIDVDTQENKHPDIAEETTQPSIIELSFKENRDIVNVGDGEILNKTNDVVLEDSKQELSDIKDNDLQSDKVLDNKKDVIDITSDETPKPLNIPETKSNETKHNEIRTNEIRPKEIKELKHDNYGWKTLGSNFWEGLKFILKKLFWIITIIALFFLSMFLLKDCQGPIHKINPFYNPLPENPVVLPIEKAHIGKSSDGMSMIATDRLNVLLEPENDDTMLEWAKAFKDIYDKDKYEIVYYNKELNILQIRVPDDEIESIKNNLPNELSKFHFEVFDEVVQESGAFVNDPMINNPQHSWYLNPIGANVAWDITFGDKDVVIAVVDNGFDVNHPELSGKLCNSYNVLTRNNYLRPVVTKDGVNAHGTHVAATAAGNYNNGSGLLGIAPNCRLMLVQVGNDNYYGALSSTAIREGVLYAINKGADVVNVSLGMSIPDNLTRLSEGQQLNYITSSYRQEELIWENIYSKAKKRNCTIVFAAGNENVISGIDPKKRSKNVIKVSALNKELNKADFSNYGVYPNLNREYSTLSAPGVSIYSAAPDNQYVSLQGTSMAAPIVSGAVALLKSIDKNLSTEQVINIFKETGENVGDNIGPMINVGRALQRLKGDTIVDDKCERIKHEVSILKAKIDSLVSICPDAAEPADTLKYADAVRDKHGLDGVWKSTTELVALADNSPLELYMSFRKLKGTLTIVNKGVTYTAKLTAQIEKGKIKIIQKEPATDGKTSFLPYIYECVSDKKGYLLCTATSAENKVVFNLIRTK